MTYGTPKSQALSLFSINNRALLAVLCLAAIIILFQNNARAQIMRLQFVVEEEFSIRNVRYVNPGLLQHGLGWVAFQNHDLSAGHFSISASENVNILVTYEAPEELTKDADNTLPVKIEAAYLNDGTNNARNAITFNDNNAFFQINNSGLMVDKMDARIHKLECWVYFYGSIYLGDVEPGVYYGFLKVRVEYP